MSTGFVAVKKAFVSNVTVANTPMVSSLVAACIDQDVNDPAQGLL